MSMGPRKKKIIKIIILLASRMDLYADEDNDSNIYSTMFDQMTAALPLVDLESPTTLQQAVIDSFDTIYDSFTTDDPNHSTVSSMAVSLGEALGEL